MLVFSYNGWGTTITFRFGSDIDQFRETQTIVSTSLPTITARLHGPSTLYSWVGTSYLAAQVRGHTMHGNCSARPTSFISDTHSAHPRKTMSIYGFQGELLSKRVDIFLLTIRNLPILVRAVS